MLWFDDMVIPVGAPNPTAAYEWMDYVYEPKNQAQIADYNYYFTPVDEVQPILEKQGSDVAKSELVFPSDDYIVDLHDPGQPAGRARGRAANRARVGVGDHRLRF